MSMNALRTPDERFASLPGYPFSPNYLTPLSDQPALRMHVIDEAPTGPSNGRVALCLHGQPTWSYLYRRMIPGLQSAGFRVVAPDLFGFGKSDKPVDEQAYTFTFHRRSLLGLISAMNLQHITLICQDWGGLLGLTIPMEMPDRFSALLVMNTMLGTGDQPLAQGFLDWRAWNAKNPDLPVAALMKRAVPHLSEAEAQAYAAPFPDATFKSGVRRFPNLVPDRPDADGAALSRLAGEWWRTAWSGPTAMAIGMTDPVLGAPVMRHLAQSIRGCPPAIELPNAGHFVQEWGEDVLAAALPLLDGRSTNGRA